MLKAVIVDSNAISRGLLNTVLMDGGYEVVGQTHTSHAGYVLAQKHHPHIFCIAREQVEDGNERGRAAARQHAEDHDLHGVRHPRRAGRAGGAGAGVHGFIVKPFKADTVLKTIRNTVLAIVKKHQAG
jgi:two-component system chemotaxis response regulator CheY